jgi:hypothetical protein
MVSQVRSASSAGLISTLKVVGNRELSGSTSDQSCRFLFVDGPFLALIFGLIKGRDLSSASP